MLTLLKEPYSDDDMNWNDDTNEYELTLQYAKANFDCNFVDDDTLVKRLKKNSRKVYNFIHYRGNNANREIVDIVLNHTKEGRAFILEVLTSQMDADCETGYNDLTNQPAITFGNGQDKPRDEVAKNMLSIDTEQIIDASAGRFGFSIVYQAPYPFGLSLAILQGFKGLE